MTPGGARRIRARAALAALAFALPGPGAGGALCPSEAAAQEVRLPPVSATHDAALFRRVEGEVHAALLAEDDETRDTHLEAAERLARHLVAQDSTSADAHYWLAVALGVRTEHSGPWEKLTTGREVFFTTARVLALDSLHAGGHELMGRLHAAVMRLPWLVRSFALRMGMGQVLGDASWAQAEAYYRRAAELDTAAIAPRLELAKLLLGQGREAEAGPVLAGAAELPARGTVEERMREEARALLRRIPVVLPARGG
ncbi:MAG: hypothetical protein FIA95_03565 [Gemmatimonadetes bacterium]|nr:hypothetical protein [Gemmatimonadota bacterium]